MAQLPILVSIIVCENSLLDNTAGKDRWIVMPEGRIAKEPRGRRMGGLLKCVLDESLEVDVMLEEKIPNAKD